MDYSKFLLAWLICLAAIPQITTGAELRNEDGAVYPWVIVVLVLVVVGLLILLLIEIIIIYKILSLGGVHCRSIWLGQLLLFAIFLSYLTLIIFVFQPTADLCRMIRFSVGFCYILIQSVLMMKVLIVLSPKTQAGFLKLGHQLLILLLLWAIQIIINVQWIVFLPSGVQSIHNNAIVCLPTHTESLYNDFLYSFIYIFIVGLVLFVLTIMAYVTKRKENGKPNSEAKWVLITSCVTTAAWLAWIIVGVFVPGATMPALAIGLWVTATATLLIMFVPKLHRLATLKHGDLDSIVIEELYIEDEMPGLVSYERNGEFVEMDAHDGSVISPPSIHGENTMYTTTEPNGGHLLTTGTLDRQPSVILEEKSNMSVSSIGPSPSVIYNANNPERVHFTSNPHALELHHPGTRTLRYVSRERDYVQSPGYYTIGGHGRHSGANSAIGIPRYERRYVQVPSNVVQHNSRTLEPRYVREVVVSPHHHVDSDGSAGTLRRYPKYAGSSSAESHRYVGSSSGSGLDSPHYNPHTGRSASVIGAPRYEGSMVKRYQNGFTNEAFTLESRNGTVQAPPTTYVEVAPGKTATLVGAPNHKVKVLRPAEAERNGLAGSRRTLSQQDLRMGLTRIPPQANGSSVAGTLPRSTKLVYKPTANGKVLPVEQRQKAFSDDVLERSSVY